MTQGGGFLIQELQPGDILTPEDFTDEHRQIGKTAAEFMTNEVMPVAGAIEAKDFTLMRGLLRKAGDLGLTAVDVPEAYGGLGMDKVSSAIVAERTSQPASFSVSFGAHAGIGTLPVVWYGTEAQKRKYLPLLATGEWIGAYALSEASSASDAMNCRASAVLGPEGTHYILNGEKMWITNSGFADLFTVFVKIDGEKFSAFLVERGTPGLSIGAEEHKMGLRGSSTCPVILTDCRVPAENLLGEVGKGHHIAFNILNLGRFKLSAACVGAARYSLDGAIAYACERTAFGKPIAGFGLIQEKLAECAAGIYVGEAMVYRTIGMIDRALADVDAEAAGAAREIQKRIEEYAVECSIVKVWGSEMLDRVVDHAVQIHGGYGFVEEYPAERAYRDSRVNRIFEGTNEINRLIITGWTMKRAASGQLPLRKAVEEFMGGVLAGGGAPTGPSTAARQMALFAAGVAWQKFGPKLSDEQEVMGALADCLMELYAIESCTLRAAKAGATRQAVCLAQYYAAGGLAAIESAARKVLAAAAAGDELRTQTAILRRLARRDAIDVVALGREIAGHLVRAGRYSL